MSEVLAKAIEAVRSNEYSFCKFVSANDAGETGAHQSGLYIPKNSIALMFESPGVKGNNKEKFAELKWQDGTTANCRFIYYGQGTRNEYRITRLNRQFVEGQLVIIVRENELSYLGFTLTTESECRAFLEEFELTDEDTNSLIYTPAYDYKKISFRPNARLILQLGDQLIRSESIAVLELIKNAYDACATKVTIHLSNLDKPGFGEIVIEDDGMGMDFNILNDVWLRPGTTWKRDQIAAGTYLNNCDRIPLGEKGIGRFGVHKLGEHIELITKTKSSKEAYLKINWSEFNTSNELSEIPIELFERDPTVFKKTASGTKIIIRELRNVWTRGEVRELFRAVNSLNSPFDKIDSFNIIFKIDRPDWLSGLLPFKDIEDSALFKVDLTINGSEIESLEYEFVPWTTMKELKGRTFSDKNIRMTQKAYDSKARKNTLQDVDLSKFKIGPVHLKLLIYDLDTHVLSLGVTDKKGLKEYLKLNGGVRVYRSKVRVYDYGEPGNDWLNLDIDRVNLPTARISNNIIIGAIQLDRLKSSDLVEKTNREGFVENAAFKEFLAAIRFSIGEVVVQRNIDKDKLRNYYNGGKKQKTPVVGHLNTLREKIEINVSGIVKQEILGIVDEIENDYKSITEVYFKSASAGLSLSIVIHEIEKIIAELLYVVEETKSPDKIKELTWHIGKLIDGYSGLIRRRSKKEFDLQQIITQSLWNVEFRLKAHNVSVVRAYEMHEDGIPKVQCVDGLIIGTLINIIDNSIWWLNYGRIKDKKLFVDISLVLTGYITIVIADNGPGFTLPTEEIIKPFISRKEGGVGVGLHIAYEIMNSHGGELLFPNAEQFAVPQEFRSGAIVALCFKTN